MATVEKQSLKRLVLDADSDLFLSRGYEGVGMRDIASAIHGGSAEECLEEIKPTLEILLRASQDGNPGTRERREFMFSED